MFSKINRFFFFYSPPPPKKSIRKRILCEKRRINPGEYLFCIFNCAMSNTFCKMTLVIKNWRNLFPIRTWAIKLLLNTAVKNSFGDNLMHEYFSETRSLRKILHTALGNVLNRNIESLISHLENNNGIVFLPATK